MATPTTTAAPTAELPAITFRQLLILAGVAFAMLVVLGVGTIGGVYWVVNSGGGPDRPSIVSADAAAEQSIRQYATSLADLYAMAAEGIERGDIGSDVEFLEYTAATEDARKRSFAAFDEAMESSLANGEWVGRDADEAQAWCESAAEGFRRLAE